MADDRVVLRAKDEASKTFNKFSKNAKKSLQETGRDVKKLALAGAALGTALATASVKSAAKLDELAKTTRALDISTTLFQAYSQASTDAGDATGDFASILEKFNKNLGEIATGVGIRSVNAFKALGVELKDNNGNFRKNTDLLQDSLSKLANLENQTQATSIALKLFGKDTKLYRDGGADIKAYVTELKVLNRTFSKEQLDAAEAATSAIDRATGTISDNYAKVFSQFSGNIVTIAAYTAAGSSALSKVLETHSDDLIKYAKYTALAISAAFVTSPIGRFVTALALAYEGGKAAGDGIYKASTLAAKGILEADKSISKLLGTKRLFKDGTKGSVELTERAAAAVAAEAAETEKLNAKVEALGKKLKEKPEVGLFEAFGDNFDAAFKAFTKIKTNAANTNNSLTDGEKKTAKELLQTKLETAQSAIKISHDTYTNLSKFQDQFGLLSAEKEKAKVDAQERSQLELLETRRAFLAEEGKLDLNAITTLNEARDRITRTSATKRSQIETSNADFILSTAKALGSALKKDSKDAFEFNKILSASEAGVNTYRGATAALATQNWVAFGATLVAGAAQIHNILSSKYNSASGINSAGITEPVQNNSDNRAFNSVINIQNTGGLSSDQLREIATDAISQQRENFEIAT